MSHYNIMHMGPKLIDAGNCVQGWIVAAVVFIANYFSGHKFIVLLVVFVTIMDAFWGICVSLKRKKFALSELGRLTVSKLAVYGCAMAVFVGLDSLADTVLTATLVGTMIVLVEFWSSCASMLILYPDFLFLRIFSKALTGEMARKLEISEEDIMEAQKAAAEEREKRREEEIRKRHERMKAKTKGGEEDGKH